MKMRCGVTYSFLANRFEVLGRKLTKNKSWFIVIPVFLSLLLATGLLKLKIDGSIKLYYTPFGSATVSAENYIKSVYSLNSHDFDPSRLTSEIRFASLIIEANDGHSILRKNIWDEIMFLHSIVYNDVNIIVDGRKWNYQDLCAKQEGKCYEDEILLASKKLQNSGAELTLSYPLDDSLKVKNFNTLSLGEVILGENGGVTSAKALKLMYVMETGSKRKEFLAKEWESKFLSEISKLKFCNITVERYASISVEEYLPLTLSYAQTCIPYTFALVIAFTISTCLTPNFLRSKPWTGVMSAVATGMSLISGFGFLLYLEYKISLLVVIVPFLVLGIGMDDTFVMLSAWKKTNPKKSLEERMGETYSETGVSITITSATNIMSFSFGAIFAYFESVRLFCFCMTVCLSFDYVYQITFVGATLALSGMAEEKHLHSFIFIPLRDNASTGTSSFVRSIFCHPVEDETKTTPKRCCKFLLEFWENLASILTTATSKILVLLMYSVYLSMAIWSFRKLNLRCTFNPSLIYDTYQDAYYMSQERNYYQYQYNVQFIINTTLNYADPVIQEKVLRMIERFESDPLFSGPLLTQFWLRSYRKFLNNKRVGYFIRDYNMSDKYSFYEILRRVFLRHPLAKDFEKDIVFNENYTDIVSSRFILQTNMTRNESDFYYKLRDFKNIVEKEEYPLLIYHPSFFYFDGLDVIFQMMVQTISLVVTLVVLISAILLPNFICTVCVGFSIVSVVTGSLGYMFLWGVSLEITSVVILIMTCGFSVDYAAHVSCAYVSCKNSDPNERLRKAVVMTGMPIFQGSVSTICVVAFFVNPPTIDFEIVTKLIFLVSVIAALHGIVLIPVVMSLLDSAWIRLRTILKTSKSNRENIDSTKSDLSPTDLCTCSICGGSSNIYTITT